jgi:poly(3-hydroxybutyrate) depolymerase
MGTLLRAIFVSATLSSVVCSQPPADPSVPAQPQVPGATPNPFAYDRAAPLSLEETPTASPRAAVSLRRITFASPGGDRVTGLLAVPTATGRHAGIVMLHGLPGNAEGAMTYQGFDFAERGAVVIAIDAPWVRRVGLPDLTVRDSVEQVQLMQDLSRAVDVLLARQDVDPARIGYVGGSYGGAMGSLFVGIERRLAAAALFVADGGLVAHFTDEDGTPLGPLADASASERARWLAAMQPIEPINFVGLAAPTALYFQNGRTDQLVSVEDANALHGAASQPKTVQWYDAGHGLTPAARVDRLNWVMAQLRLR